MADAFASKEGGRTAIILLVILFVIIAIAALFLGGPEGLFGVLKFFFTISLIAGFVALVFYIVWYIFIRKPKIDVPHILWKEYLRSALDNGPDMMTELILTGDAKHSAKKFMTIKGYLRIRAFDGEEYDMFVGKRSPMNFMEDWKIVMLRPEEHTDLIGEVYVQGISFILKYGYYFLNNSMLEFTRIDQSVAMDTFRQITYMTLGDMKSIVDRAVGIDPEEIRRRNAEKLLKIPMMPGQQQQNPPPQQ